MSNAWLIEQYEIFTIIYLIYSSLLIATIFMCIKDDYISKEEEKFVKDNLNKSIIVFFVLTIVNIIFLMLIN